MSKDNHQNKQKRKFVGAWLDGATYAALVADAEKNQRSIAGELRARLAALKGRRFFLS
jgi:hypothetical protein